MSAERAAAEKEADRLSSDIIQTARIEAQEEAETLNDQIIEIAKQ